MKLTKKILTTTLTALIAIGISPVTAGEKKDKEAAKETTMISASKEVKKEDVRVPFNGTISAVDKEARTFSLKGKEPRVFLIGEKTIMMKNTSLATWDDFVIGEKVRGSGIKTADGKWEAITVKFGKKGAEEEKMETEAEQKE